MKTLSRKLMSLAQQGDVAAARLIMQYCLGRPPEMALDSDEELLRLRRELDEWRLTSEVDPIRLHEDRMLREVFGTK